jgi:hypothetical protein
MGHDKDIHQNQPQKWPQFDLDQTQREMEDGIQDIVQII